MTDSIATQLKQASKGLLFLSETDAPVELRTVDDFFAIATKEEDWHDEEERETVQQFQNLVSVLKHNLSQLQVYRIGSTNIDAYIVGVAQSGDWAGLSTKLVET